jgi:hypothetical protein
VLQSRERPSAVTNRPPQLVAHSELTCCRESRVVRCTTRADW